MCFFSSHAECFTFNVSGQQLCGGTFSTVSKTSFITSWVSSDWAQFWCYLPGDSIRSHRFKVSVPQDCLHPTDILQIYFSWKPGLSPVLLTNQLLIGSFNDPLYGFDLFARVTHRTHRNTWVYQFIKGHNKGYRWIARWRDTWGRSGRVPSTRASIFMEWNASPPHSPPPPVWMCLLT